MAQRFRAPRYREDALAGLPHAGRGVPLEQPRRATRSSRRVEMRAPDGRPPQLDGRRARVPRHLPRGRAAPPARRTLLREREPASPLPKAAAARPGPASSTCAPGAATPRRAWWSTSSARCRIQHDRAFAPDRLWIDLVGTRLHPNLANRAFPVGDGLLEQVRVGQNRDDVVRVVLDFKDVEGPPGLLPGGPDAPRDRRARPQPSPRPQVADRAHARAEASRGRPQPSTVPRRTARRIPSCPRAHRPGSDRRLVSPRRVPRDRCRARSRSPGVDRPPTRSPRHARSRRLGGPAGRAAADSRGRATPPRCPTPAAATDPTARAPTASRASSAWARAGS